MSRQDPCLNSRQVTAITVGVPRKTPAANESAEPPTTQEIVTEYVRDYLLACKRRGETWREMGERLGTSHARLVQVADPGSYPRTKVGVDLEEAVAKALHGGSIDALRTAARSFVRTPGVAIFVEGDDRGE
jgi:hypothetical protein